MPGEQKDKQAADQPEKSPVLLQREAACDAHPALQWREHWPQKPTQPTSREVASRGSARRTHQPCNGGGAGHGLGRVTHQPCSGEVAGQGSGQENQCLVCPC